MWAFMCPRLCVLAIEYWNSSLVDDGGGLARVEQQMMQPYGESEVIGWLTQTLLLVA